MVFGNYYFAGGPASLVVLMLTAAALFGALVAVVVSAIVRNAIVPAIGCSVLVFGALVIAAIGVGAGLYARQRADAAMFEVDPTQRAAIEAEAEVESRQPMLMGVLGAALPGLAGAGLGLLALRRRAGGA